MVDIDDEEMPPDQDPEELEEESPDQDADLEFDLDDLDDPAEPESEDPGIYLDEDQPNLVDELQSSERGREFLEGTVRDCCELFDESWQRNSERREKNAQALKMFYGEAKRKDSPFENCASVHVPLMMQNVLRYVNKIVGEVFGDWSEVVRFRPLDPAKSDMADIASAHTNWQLSRAVPGFKRQMHRAVNIFTVLGDVVCHSYYDPARRRNCHDMLTSDDFVVPWSHVSVADDFSDIPWLARVLVMHRSELRRMKRVWSNVEEVLAEDADETDIEQEMRLSAAERTGEGEPDAEEMGDNYKIVWWEGYVEIPGHDQDRYCQVIFDKGSRKCLKFSIHEEASAEELSRFDFETREFQVWQSEMTQRQDFLERQEQSLQQATQLAPAAEEGDPAAQEQFLQANQLAQQPMPPEPVQPMWMEAPGQEPRPPDKLPIHMFSHGVCMEPLLGVIGVGIGRIESDLNTAGNIVLNQFLDAATLGNGKTLITAGTVRFPDPFRVAPGHINKAANVAPGDLRNSIMPLEFGQANPQLIQALQLFMKAGEDAGSTPEVLSGAPGKSGETARGVQLRTEQANLMLSVPTNRFADFVLQVIRNNSKLNAKFMSDAEAFFPSRQGMPAAELRREVLRATREIYDNDFEIELTRDLLFKPKTARVAEADELVQLPKVVEQLQGNPALIWESLRGSFEARGRRDLVAYLGERPQIGKGPLGTVIPEAPPGGQPGQPPGPPGKPPQGGQGGNTQ
jgi:hypothetical protein